MSIPVVSQPLEFIPPIQKWSPPPRAVRVPSDGIDLWKIRLDPALYDLEGIFQCLPADEKARAARLQSDFTRSRFLIGRYALRSIIGVYTSTTAMEVPFEYGDRGKPRLPSSFGGPYFNLSHSGDIAVLAVTGIDDVGIDIEQIRKVGQLDRIAERFFKQADAAHLKTLRIHEALPLFFSLWTGLEARHKVLGHGVFNPETTLATNDADSFPALPLVPEEGYIGAISMCRQIPPRHLWNSYEFTKIFPFHAEKE